jgi:HSP20 family molecular chaperone IbpA
MGRKAKRFAYKKQGQKEVVMKPARTSQQAAEKQKQLKFKTIQDLNWETQQVQLEVARLAYELFKTRGYERGHDWEDWFRAESELLRPVPVAISESDDQISVRANVLSFDETELSVGVEPRRITILGKKLPRVVDSSGGKLESTDWSPDLLMKVIDLPAEISPERSQVRFLSGLLSFELPKAAKQKTNNVAVAA